MSVSVTINASVSGIGSSPLNATIQATGDNGLQMHEACPANDTTTLSLPMIFDPDAKVKVFAAMINGVSGDTTTTATLIWDGSGTDVTVTLTSGQPIIRDSVVFGLANIPTSSDTYTLKLVTGAVSVTFDGRLLFDD